MQCVPSVKHNNRKHWTTIKAAIYIIHCQNIKFQFYIAKNVNIEFECELEKEKKVKVIGCILKLFKLTFSQMLKKSQYLLWEIKASENVLNNCFERKQIECDNNAKLKATQFSLAYICRVSTFETFFDPFTSIVAHLSRH